MRNRYLVSIPAAALPPQAELQGENASHALENARGLFVGHPALVEQIPNQTGAD